MVLGAILHLVGLEGVLDVFIRETMHRVGLGEVLVVVIEETLHQVGLGEFLDVVLGETLHRDMTRSRAGCGTGEKISLHTLEIRPKEVRLCNFVYSIYSAYILIFSCVTWDSFFSLFVRIRTVRRLISRQDVG